MDVINKSIDRKSVDSLYLIKILSLLDFKRNEIYNNSFSYSNKLNQIQLVLDDYNKNKLNLNSQIPLFDDVDKKFELIEYDLFNYQFEKNWKKRIYKLNEFIEAEIEKKGSHIASVF